MTTPTNYITSPSRRIAFMLRLTVTAIFAAVVTAAHATDVNVMNPGSLQLLISNPEQISSLAISGNIDARDLFFISEACPELKTLDLSKATIKRYEGDKIGYANLHRENVIPASVFAGCKIMSVYLPSTSEIEIGDMAFAGSAIENLNTSNITKLGMGAFSSCAALKSVSISGSPEWESHVFANCPSLISVNLTGTESVGAAAFAGCASLTTVNGSVNLTAIGDKAFNGCSKLSEFDFGYRLTAIGAEAFAHTGLTEADLASTSPSLSILGDWAFAHCEHLAHASLPGIVEIIGQGLFFDCKNLETLTTGSWVTEISDYSLKGVERMTEVKIPPRTEHIGSLAMSGMNGLTTIDASGLTDVPTLGREVWDALAKQDIDLKVYDALANDFLAAEQWQDFNIIAGASGIEDIMAEDKATTKISGRFDGMMLIMQSTGAPLKEISIYDTSGRLLARHSATATEAQIDTTPLNTHIFIIEAFTADNTRGALKIIRN